VDFELENFNSVAENNRELSDISKNKLIKMDTITLLIFSLNIFN